MKTEHFTPKKPKYLISLACYEHKVYWQTALSLFYLGATKQPFPVEFSVDIFANTFITTARNQSATTVLEDPDITGILYVDADMGFFPGEVFRLLSLNMEGYKVVGGNYTFKFIHWPLVEQGVKEGVPVENLKHFCALMNSDPLPPEEQLSEDILKVNYLGMGLTAVHRSVLEAIYAKHPEKLVSQNKDGTKRIFEVFKQGHTDLGYFGTEDAYFCALAQSVGFSSYWPKEIRPAHVGVMTFAPGFADRMADLNPHAGILAPKEEEGENK